MASRRTLAASLALWCATGGAASAQLGQPPAGPPRGDRLAPLPLTQVDERAMAVDAADVSGKIGLAFRLATCRVPTADESAVLLDTYQTHLATYQQNAAAAEALVNIGETKRNAALDVPQLAAMTLVCNLILNLDETVTKE